MKGAPWFKFYPSDFMAGVAELTSEERGSYISLLCHQWATGDLPCDRMRMERLAGGPVSDAVAGKFVPATTPGRVYNVRLESHREEAQRRSIAGKTAVDRREEKRASIDQPSIIDRSSTDEAPMHQRLDARGQILEDRGEMAEAEANPPKPPSKREAIVDDPDAGYPEDFLAFWKAFPGLRKKKKGHALRAWKAATKRRTPAFIMDSLERHKESCDDWIKDGGQFIPGPEVWLNGGGYDAADALPKPEPIRYRDDGTRAF